MEQTLDISWRAIIKVVITCFVLYILFLIRHVALWFFFGLIISILLDPAVDFLRKFRVPKVIAVIVMYVAIFGLLGLMIYLTAPIFIFEIHQLYLNIPSYFEKINPLLKGLGLSAAQNFQDFNKDFISNLQENSDSIVKAFSIFFGGISSMLSILTIAFFISLEDKSMEKILSFLLPERYERNVVTILERVEYKVSGWFGARVLACIFVGALSFIVFFLLDIKYAFTLALISGVLTFIPFVGPMITALLVLVFVGVSNSWWVALYAIIALVVIQEIENKFITPLLMKKFLDLPPVLVLLSLLVGGAILGFLGIIFIVPIVGIIYEFLKEFLEKKKENMTY